MRLSFTETLHAPMQRCCRKRFPELHFTHCVSQGNRSGQRNGGGTKEGPEKVQMYLPSAADLHGWEKKLFSSAFHAREIINKLIIY